MLKVGTEEEPYEQEATIELYGSLRSEELPIYGAKVLAVRDGHLGLYGKETAIDFHPHVLSLPHSGKFLNGRLLVYVGNFFRKANNFLKFLTFRQSAAKLWEWMVIFCNYAHMRVTICLRYTPAHLWNKNTW